MRILITGAAGFIGSHLSDRLIEEGHDVTGVDNLRTGNWTRTSDRLSKIERDLTELSLEELEGILEDVEILFHLAAVKHNTERGDTDDLLLNNIVSTNRLFEAAGKSGVKKVIFTSSLYAYGRYGPETMSEEMAAEPDTEYGISKLAGEMLLKEKARKFGFQYSVLRLFFIYGPKQYAGSGYKSVIVKNAEQAFSNRPLTIYGDGEQTLDYVFIDDCIEALHLAMTRPHESPINISTGVGVTINAAINKLKALNPGTTTINLDSDWTHGTYRVGNPRRAQKELIWQSKVPFSSGVEKFINWMRSENK